MPALARRVPFRGHMRLYSLVTERPRSRSWGRFYSAERSLPTRAPRSDFRNVRDSEAYSRRSPGINGWPFPRPAAGPPPSSVAGADWS